MRPRCRCAVLQAYVWALLLLLFAAADGEDPDCEDILQVDRNTVYNASLHRSLQIPCPVQFCQNAKKYIFWSKLEGTFFSNTTIASSSHISTNLIMSSLLKGTSYLMFNNIQVNDSGLYRCSSGDAVSFHIKVSVSGISEVKNLTSGTDLKTHEAPLMYIYTSAGIVAFVVMVIVVSVVWMRSCKGKPRTEPERDVQYTAIMMRQRPSPSGDPSTTTSRGSSRRSSQRQTPAPLQRQREITAGGEQRPKTAEENSSLVYAALNHQPVEGAASSRPRRPKEEKSEYAAICVS